MKTSKTKNLIIIKCLTLFFIFLALPQFSNAIDHLGLKIVKGAYSDESIIAFRTGATESFDPPFDAHKLFSNNASVPSIYSKSLENYSLSINSLPPLDLSVQIPVYLKFNNSGTFTINIENNVSLPNLLVQLVDLRDNSVYEINGAQMMFSFNASGAETGASAWFEIRITPTNIQPVVTASGPLTFCSNDSVVLTSSQGDSYLWSTGQTTCSVTVKTSGEVSVTVFDSNGNSAISDSLSITVIPAPVAVINTIGNSSFCPGDSVILYAGYAGIYVWNTGETSNSITVKSAGSYSFTLWNQNNCSAVSQTVIVDILASPIPEITSNTSLAFCDGDSVILNSSCAELFFWSNGQNTKSITVKTHGDYFVKVIDINGCMGYDTVEVRVNFLPLVDLGPDSDLPAGSEVILDAQNSGSTYIWSTGVTTQDITVNTPGEYFVKVTDALGCSNSDTIDFNLIIGIEKFSQEIIELQVFPNPNNGRFNLSFKPFDSDQVMVGIYNNTGKQIMWEKINGTESYNNNFDLSTMAPGVYFFKLMYSENTITKKIMIQ
ncbi:MAG: T9SS type A sorting domain-containing protein [Bacteroidetes bacterium]|nr:T9SS type A sorting domain-containing protein [Bacteroidota bacterium]HET6244956.1 T9SS type A sorting domain-containing protein [Bacteroidia bacterium]